LVKKRLAGPDLIESGGTTKNHGAGEYEDRDAQKNPIKKKNRRKRGRATPESGGAASFDRKEGLAHRQSPGKFGQTPEKEKKKEKKKGKSGRCTGWVWGN